MNRLQKQKSVCKCRQLYVNATTNNNPLQRISTWEHWVLHQNSPEQHQNPNKGVMGVCEAAIQHQPRLQFQNIQFQVEALCRIAYTCLYSSKSQDATNVERWQPPGKTAWPNGFK
ncbi:Hypothetical_protein [Hexamita inflata]|uniref:Hypothetical_protein n=1 Tax=Hexamita inflata TaxID=28002 RepID=A0AA86R1G1_9EUKA|nr:Hypothetical protein HINF_LOCUS12648 [Hexamita inflata]CAI9965211.1 Hypothetical protein HINF_LOCUS52856 [Hexamita inflata]